MIELKNINYTYNNQDRMAGVQNINLKIETGQVVLLCGKSGCGKTTLTRLINGLIPNFYSGKLSGEVFVKGKSLLDLSLQEISKIVGSVFQNPRSQFFNLDTDSEIVFACENHGLPEEIILQRLEQTIIDFRIEKLRNRSLFALSGGEKQKIACASVNASDPDIIVLDEPSSNLDSLATLDLAKIIARWKKQGKTIIIAEHRLYYLSDIVDRIIYMEDGNIIKDFCPSELSLMGYDTLTAMGLRATTIANICSDCKCMQDDLCIQKADSELQFQDFCFSYKSQRHNVSALDIKQLTLPKGSAVAVIGYNGAGKSTFARCLTGISRNKGILTISGSKAKKLKTRDRLNCAYMVMQDVNHQLFTESVLDEILLSMKTEDSKTANDIMNWLNLSDLADSHPMSLSGGQKQRVSIASAVASDRDIILFDEPTSGLDFVHMQEVAALILKLRNSDKTQFIISHDPELILSCCNYVIELNMGCVQDIYSLNQSSKNKLLQFFFPEQKLIV